eukprot:TRINITY_DN1989_c1_g1_i1.p1 TRINITY_DN1989_c1_g1~~TRINITY_DN1989_c1_g1_i1.p1  ORF type:complete len:413 (-),score=125.21 TRINITY_DN1989_c1_g1_i1:761-1999(-)
MEEERHLKRAETLEEQLREKDTVIIKLKQQFEDRETSLQNDLSEYTKALVAAHRSLEDKTLEAQKLSSQAKGLSAENQTLRQELVEYKRRAANVLHQKEKAIENLNTQLQQGDEQSPTSSSTSQSVDSQSIESLKKELQAIKQSYENATKEIQQLRSAISEYENQAEVERKQFEEEIKEMDASLEKEKKKNVALMSELNSKSQQLTLLREEGEKSTLEHETEIARREDEIQKLRKQIALKSQQNGLSELENRLRTMTEHLIEKQSMLERTKSENTALLIQLDNQKQQIQQLTANATSIAKTTQEGGDIEEASGGPSLMRYRSSTTATANASIPPPLSTLLPATFSSEGYVSRKVVRAANLLDTLSAEIGNFLRRYPLARLFAFFYIFLLQMWLVVVLSHKSPGTNISEATPP